MNKYAFGFMLISIAFALTGVHAIIVGSDIASLRADLQNMPSCTHEVEKAAPAQAESMESRFYWALRQVEGGWDGKIGKDGECGPYQITLDYWMDATDGTDWHNEQSYRVLVFDQDACEYVLWRYWNRYGAETWEEKARMHNGGPSMAGTDDYWNRVKNLMGV